MRHTSLTVATIGLAVFVAAPSAHAVGVFGTVPFSGDATSGISSANTYTHAVDFASEAGDNGAVINGVQFIAGGLVGANYTLVIPGSLGTFNGSTGNVTGGSADLLDDFFHVSGTSTGSETLTLTGLIPGATYLTTFLNEAFGPAGGRFQNITTSDGAAILFDQNFTGDNNGNLLTYRYTATSPSLTFSFDAVVDNSSFHQYGFANQLVVPEPATASLALLGLGGLMLRRRRMA